MATPRLTLPRPDGRGFAGEDQEGDLESVLRVLVVADHATADAEDHPAVPTDESFKGGLVTAVNE
jgi:hypothetical protein